MAFTQNAGGFATKQPLLPGQTDDAMYSQQPPQNPGAFPPQQYQPQGPPPSYSQSQYPPPSQGYPGGVQPAGYPAYPPQQQQPGGGVYPGGVGGYPGNQGYNPGGYPQQQQQQPYGYPQGQPVQQQPGVTVVEEKSGGMGDCAKMCCCCLAGYCLCEAVCDMLSCLCSICFGD